MTVAISNTYFVGKDQPYESVNQAINSIASAIQSGDYTLPSPSLSDGGNVNIIIVGNGKFSAINIPDNLTPPLRDAGRYLVIRRQEYAENGTLITNALPIIMPGENEDLFIEDRLIGINVGHNNPNVKIVGLRVEGFVIGLSSGFNSNSLYIDRCFFVNSINTQLYASNSARLYITNSIFVGGQYGIVTQNVSHTRIYHNTIFLDGSVALNNATKAGVIVQGERLINNLSPSSLYFLGNIVYTIGCPAVIFYEEDLKTNRLISDYNDIYSQDILVQLRQDNAQLPSESEQIIRRNYYSLSEWRNAGMLGTSPTKTIDQSSISVHPVFIHTFSLTTYETSSLVNLSLLGSSPVLGRVPAWYYDVDVFYAPADFDTGTIATDILLSQRSQPFTAIGCNDIPSMRGFFGQDIFTNPISLDPERKCDLDPLRVVSSQSINMQYPAIKAGYFYSHERPYYLYGKKFAASLGYFAKTSFTLPKPIIVTSIKTKGTSLSKEDWDVSGNIVSIYHRNNGITSYNNEIEINGKVKTWGGGTFSFSDGMYIFKIRDGETIFVLPMEYNSNAPTVITDDRISYLNPSDVVQREFCIKLVDDESIIEFGGNENLFNNSEFSTSYSNGDKPAEWVTSQFDNEFLLAAQYAYYGDKALALRTDHLQGYITSQPIKVESGNEFSFTWHARIPDGILHRTNGSAITELTASYRIDFYDIYDEVIPGSLYGSFDMTTSYKRYLLPFGSASTVFPINLPSLESAPLVALSPSPLVMPDKTYKVELTIGANDNSTNVPDETFIILDALQAEFSAIPSYYHPRPSLTAMTVECEVSEDNIFIDKRMNISAVANENPNGFLFISDMPAHIWGGPVDPEVTTLHEYRWPHGRINVLPWARLHGKDKLNEKTILSQELTKPKGIIAPYINAPRAASAKITPGYINLNQEANLPEGFRVQVLDEMKNPFALRNYVAHIYDPNNHFPGWLSKKYYGSKQQLGSTIFGSLSSNGSFSAEYLTPSPSHIRYIGLVPFSIPSAEGSDVAVDQIAVVKTNYDISLANHGNVTIIGKEGKFHNLYGEKNTNRYSVENSDGKFIVALEYPPMIGSVSIKLNSEEFIESQIFPQHREFKVDYALGHIEFSPSIGIGAEVDISYTPVYAYPIPGAQNNLVLHLDKIFEDYNDFIEIDYDAELKLEVRVSDALNREFVSTFPIVAQNPKLKDYNKQLSLEY